MQGIINLPSGFRPENDRARAILCFMQETNNTTDHFVIDRGGRYGNHDDGWRRGYRARELPIQSLSPI